MLDEWVDPPSHYSVQSSQTGSKICTDSYAIFSSKSLGMDISSTLSTRFEADSSSKEMTACFRHVSKEGSVRKAAKTPSSLIIGWLLSEIGQQREAVDQASTNTIKFRALAKPRLFNIARVNN